MPPPPFARLAGDLRVSIFFFTNLKSCPFKLVLVLLVCIFIELGAVLLMSILGMPRFKLELAFSSYCVLSVFSGGLYWHECCSWVRSCSLLILIGKDRVSIS